MRHTVRSLVAGCVAATLATTAQGQAAPAPSRASFEISGSAGIAPDRLFDPSVSRYLETVGVQLGTYRALSHTFGVEAHVGVQADRLEVFLREPVRRTTTIERYRGAADHEAMYVPIEVRGRAARAIGSRGGEIRAAAGVGYLAGLGAPTVSLGAGGRVPGRGPRATVSVEHWLAWMPAERALYVAGPSLASRATLTTTDAFRVVKHATQLRLGVEWAR